MNNPDSKEALERLLQRIKKEKSLAHKLKKQPIYKFVAAALIVGIMMSVYFFKDNFFYSNIENSTPTIVKTIIEPGTNKAILTLEDGSQIDLEKGTTVQTQHASSNGNEIVYEAGKKITEETIYNYLTIPRGGQFFIKLSDGTQVWLNSESQLKYPVTFIDGQTRQVELVYGEAYFDVSPSIKHKDSKFKVSNQYQEIEVLGTEFNIKAYKDDANIYTTLVEGKISINTEITNQILKPSQQSNLNINNKSIFTNTVNVYNEISWKEGVFRFRRKPLGEIMKVLSRWYDIDINFVNSDIEKAGFNGVLRKNLKIEDILENIKQFGTINDYEINDKTIVLK